MKRLAVLMAVDRPGLMLVAPLMPFYALRLHAPECLIGPRMGPLGRRSESEAKSVEGQS